MQRSIRKMNHKKFIGKFFLDLENFDFLGCIFRIYHLNKDGKFNAELVHIGDNNGFNFKIGSKTHLVIPNEIKDNNIFDSKEEAIEKFKKIKAIY